MKDKKTILIIEDDTSLQTAYQQKLAGAGFEVWLASTVADAWQKIKEVSPDLILLDIMLPGGMHGFDLLEQLKRDPNYSHIPVVVVTNLDTETKVAEMLGVKDYLIKANTSLNQIIEIIKKYFPKAGENE